MKILPKIGSGLIFVGGVLTGIFLLFVWLAMVVGLGDKFIYIRGPMEMHHTQEIERLQKEVFDLKAACVCKCKCDCWAQQQYLENIHDDMSREVEASWETIQALHGQIDVYREKCGLIEGK